MSTHAEADLWPAPHASEPVRATVSLPGSKSLTNRALVLAALADGPSVVRRALRSRDTELMAAALTSLGSPVDTSGEDWRVAPGPLRTRPLKTSATRSRSAWVRAVNGLTDSGPPKPRFENVEDRIRYLHWLGEMSDRLHRRMPDRAA